MACLKEIPLAVIEKEFKMCQPNIRGQTSYIGFRIDLKSNNTWSGPHKEYLWQLFSRYLQQFLRRSSKCVSESENKADIFDFR